MRGVGKSPAGESNSIRNSEGYCLSPVGLEGTRSGITSEVKTEDEKRGEQRALDLVVR